MERTYSGDHLLRSTGGSANAGGDISDAIEAITTVPRRMAPQPSVSLVISILPGSSRFALQRGRRSWPLDRRIGRFCFYVSQRWIDTFSDHSLPVNAFGSYIVSRNRTLLAEVVRDISQYASSLGSRPWAKQTPLRPSHPRGPIPSVLPAKALRCTN